MRSSFQFASLAMFYAAAIGVITAVSVAIAPAVNPSVPPDGLFCSDRHGNRVLDGVEYMPEDDPCKKCQCQTGFPVMCRSVLCSPPSPPACDKYESSKNECCEFRCLQPSLDVHGNSVNGSNHIFPLHKDINSVNLSIRLVASAVTSLLIIALLIFMIHRLRQRRLLITMRRLNNERRSVNESLAYMTNIDQLGVGFEFPPYEDPPPPYSPPKPHHDFPNDDPPPYELTSPIPLEAGNDSNSSIRGSVGLRFSAIGTRRSGNVPLTRKHLLRPYSAEERRYPELIELTRLNHQSRSTVAVSSPILSRTGQNNNFLPNNPTISDASCGNFESQNFGSDVSSTEELCLPFAQQAAGSSLVNQLLGSSAVHVLHQRTACFSLPKSPNELDNTMLDEQRKQSENRQNPFYAADLFWSTSPKGNAECLDRFETLRDPTSGHLDEENYRDTTRVIQMSDCNAMVASSGGDRTVAQKTAPEVSFPCHLSCLGPCKEDRLQNPGNMRNAASKSKLSLFSGSVLKKKKLKNRRPLSCTEPVSDAISNISTRDSFPALNLSAEHYKTKVDNGNVEGLEEIAMVPVNQFARPSLCSYSPSSRHSQLCRMEPDTNVNVDPQDVDPASSPSLRQDTVKLVDDTNDKSFVQLLSPGNGCALTPESPNYQHPIRQGSVTSDTSFFSICSETGENKHSKNIFSSAHHAMALQNSVLNSNGACLQYPHGSLIDNIRQPILATDIVLGSSPNEASTLGLTVCGAADSLIHNSKSNWIFKPEHSAGKNSYILPGKKRERKRSTDYPITLNNSWSILQSKSSKGQFCPHFENCHHNNQSCTQCHEQSKTKNLEKNSSKLNQINFNAELWNPSLYNCLNEDKISCENDSHTPSKELITETKKGVESDHVRHSCSKCKEHVTSSGHKHKSKQQESFEHLVNRILQQLETAYFDDFGVHTSKGQKSRRPHSFDHQSSGLSMDHLCAPGRNIRKQVSRPFSLPSARNRLISNDVIRSKLAALDIAKKKGGKVDTCEATNDNECRQILHSHGGQVCNCFDQPHAEV